MSSWRSGRLSLKCSIDILQKALIGITPEWKDRIIVGGDIKVNNQVCDLVITADSSGKWSRGSLYNDVGFKKEANGQWICISRDSGVNFNDKLKKEIATMTIKDNAMRRRATLVEEGDDKGYRRMVFHVPVDGPMKWGE